MLVVSHSSCWLKHTRYANTSWRKEEGSMDRHTHICTYSYTTSHNEIDSEISLVVYSIAGRLDPKVFVNCLQGLVSR